MHFHLHVPVLLSPWIYSAALLKAFGVNYILLSVGRWTLASNTLNIFNCIESIHHDHLHLLLRRLLVIHLHIHKLLARFGYLLIIIAISYLALDYNACRFGVVCGLRSIGRCILWYIIVINETSNYLSNDTYIGETTFDQSYGSKLRDHLEPISTYWNGRDGDLHLNYITHPESHRINLTKPVHNCKLAGLMV